MSPVSGPSDSSSLVIGGNDHAKTIVLSGKTPGSIVILRNKPTDEGSAVTTSTNPIGQHQKVFLRPLQIQLLREIESEQSTSQIDLDMRDTENNEECDPSCEYSDEEFFDCDDDDEEEFEDNDENDSIFGDEENYEHLENEQESVNSFDNNKRILINNDDVNVRDNKNILQLQTISVKSFKRTPNDVTVTAETEILPNTLKTVTFKQESNYDEEITVENHPWDAQETITTEENSTIVENVYCAEGIIRNLEYGNIPSEEALRNEQDDTSDEDYIYPGKDLGKQTISRKSLTKKKKKQLSKARKINQNKVSLYNKNKTLPNNKNYLMYRDMHGPSLYGRGNIVNGDSRTPDVGNKYNGAADVSPNRVRSIGIQCERPTICPIQNELINEMSVMNELFKYQAQEIIRRQSLLRTEYKRQLSPNSSTYVKKMRYDYGNSNHESTNTSSVNNRLRVVKKLRTKDNTVEIEICDN